MSYLGRKREEVEEAVEADILAVALAMIPDDPGEEDLKLARDYFPVYFGGLFPALGVSVERTEGESKYRDKPHLPALVRGRIIIYYPSLPAGGMSTMQDDRTGKAKKITRRLRGQLIERIYSDSRVGRNFVVVDSLASDRDAVGNAQADERGKDILWKDQTQFVVEV